MDNNVVNIFDQTTDIYDDQIIGTYFSRNLRQYRKLNGLTQQQVADKLGLSKHSVVCNWEKGIASPSIKTLVRLCKLYGITANQALGFNED